MEQRKSLLQKLTFFLIFAVISVYILIIAKQLLYTLVLAILFSYFIFPLVNLFESKLRFPRLLAILLSLILFGGFMYGVGSLVAVQIKVFVADFPQLKVQALDNLDALQTYINKSFGVTIVEQETWAKEKVREFFTSGGETLLNVFHGAAGALEVMIFVPIFSFFMLSYRDRAENFVYKLAKKRNGNLTKKLLTQISKVTIKYVTGVLSIVAIMAVSHSMALSIIGVKYAIILGVMAALLSVIPYFGTLVGGIIPLAISAVTVGDPTILLMIILYFWAMIFLDHNILTPTIVGGQVSLNPFITILGIIVAGRIWGVPGMVVIVPVLAVIKIICDNVERLKPWGYILGADEHGEPFDKIKQLYNRIRRNKT